MFLCFGLRLGEQLVVLLFQRWARLESLEPEAQRRGGAPSRAGEGGVPIKTRSPKNGVCVSLSCLKACFCLVAQASQMMNHEVARSKHLVGANAEVVSTSLFATVFSLVLGRE